MIIASKIEPRVLRFGAPHGVKAEGADWSGGADPQRDGMAIAVWRRR